MLGIHRSTPTTKIRLARDIDMTSQCRWQSVSRQCFRLAPRAPQWHIVALAATARPGLELHPSLLWAQLDSLSRSYDPSAAVSHGSPSNSGSFDPALHLQYPIESLLPFQAASTTWFQAPEGVLGNQRRNRDPARLTVPRPEPFRVHEAVLTAVGPEHSMRPSLSRLSHLLYPIAPRPLVNPASKR